MEFKANFVIVDCETGGLKSTDNPIVEICVIAINNNLEDIGLYSSIIAPYGNYQITQGALNANGMTLEQIKSGKPSDQVIAELIDFLRPLKMGREKPILCGHNIDHFDIPFIDEFFTFHKKKVSDYFNDKFTIDTLWWSRVAWQESTNYQLATACSNAGIELVNAHRAETDTNANKDLVKYFLKNLRGEGMSKDKVQEERFRSTFQF